MQIDRALVARVLVERFDLTPEVAAERFDETALGFTPDASASDAVIQREIAAQEEAIVQKLSVSVADVSNFAPLHRAQVAVDVPTSQ
jgi:hypothetical protein